MTNSLFIAEDFSFPPDAITQTFAILAKRGSGKTYTALVIAEEMLRLGLPFVMIDPVGVCWGLRTSADGQHDGLPVIVLGGEHGDLQIESTSGTAIAEFVCEERQSVVLDLSGFSGNQMTQFVTDFAETLYQKNRQPLHLFLDEADAFSPQKPLPGEQRMLGAIDRIVRRGRAKGLGVTLITQRPAVLHKNVLTQIEVLIALRIVSPQDRKAIESWIEVHGTAEQRDELMNSLPSLPIGTAWIWSPGWLNTFQQVEVRQRTTFDSSATPTLQSEVFIPEKLAKVDLSALQRRITVEVPKDKDSTQVGKLKQRIAELELQLQQSSQPIEIPVFQDGEVQRLEVAVESLLEFGDRAVAIATEISNLLKTTMTGLEGELVLRKPVEVEAKSPEGDITLRSGETRMLETLARHYPMKLTRAQLGTLSDFSPSGGTFGTYLSNLKRHQLVLDANGELQITETGLNQLGLTKPSPRTTQERLTMWRSALRAGERKMLDELLKVYPKSLSRQQLGDRSGYEPTGGTFGTYLGNLRRNGLVEVNGSSVCASKFLSEQAVESDRP